MANFTDIEIISMIHSGTQRAEDQALSYLYKTHYEPMKASTHRYRLSQEAFKDVFQESMAVLYYHIKQRKADLGKGSLGGMLHAIIRRKVMNVLRNRQNKHLVTMEPEREIQVSDDFFDLLEQSETQKEVLAKIQKLGGKCQAVLKMYYFDRYSMEVICTRMELASENAAKMTKSRCIKKLRTFFT